MRRLRPFGEAVVRTEASGGADAGAFTFGAVPIPPVRACGGIGTGSPQTISDPHRPRMATAASRSATTKSPPSALIRV